MDNFESRFGFPQPAPLKELFTSKARRAPVEFSFEHVGFKLEIQYFLDPQDPSNQDPERGYLTFAVTSDGFPLLIDVKQEGLPILQEEFGDIDEIGLSVADLLRSMSSLDR